jgi:hypothetical protein
VIARASGTVDRRSTPRRHVRAWLAAVVPFAPLALMLGVLGVIALLTPSYEAPAVVAAAPRGGRGASAMATATPLGIDLVFRELSIPPERRQRWYQVVDTDGAGVFLRNTPNMADRKSVIGEGVLLVEAAPSPHAGWLHVTTPPAGPTGWIPAQYARLVP